MRTRSLLSTTLAAAALAAAPVAAQQARPGIVESTPAVFHVAPYVGYMIYGDFLKGPIGTTLSSKNGPLYGAQVGVDISPNIQLLGNVAYGTSDLQVGVPIIGGIGVGSDHVWVYDGDVQFSIPTGTTRSVPITPFVQLGAGAMTFKITNSLINTSATNFAANAGVGVDVQASRNFAVRLMAKDYVGKFNFKDATGLGLQGKTAQNIALSAGVQIGF